MHRAEINLFYRVSGADVGSQRSEYEVIAAAILKAGASHESGQDTASDSRSSSTHDSHYQSNLKAINDEARMTDIERQIQMLRYELLIRGKARSTLGHDMKERRRSLEGHLSFRNADDGFSCRASRPKNRVSGIGGVIQYQIIESRIDGTGTVVDVLLPSANDSRQSRVDRSAVSNESLDVPPADIDPVQNPRDLVSHTPLYPVHTEVSENSYY